MLSTEPMVTHIHCQKHLYIQASELDLESMEKVHQVL